jgi:ArsR family transcriptional regulator
MSHQLRTLRDLRLVRRRREGRQVFYTLDDDHVADLFQRGLEHVAHG